MASWFPSWKERPLWGRTHVQCFS